MNNSYICFVIGTNSNTSFGFQLNFKVMFGLFKKKSEKENLQAQYERLMKEAFSLSRTNRKLSDDKVFEADRVMQRLQQLN